ncbi:MAG TPA: hypothetical protein VFT87_02670 [Candidatus Saccharimonadales bacterium]|nr:hypothetical protein [Candidatus Saccharimonadales bacterium]
MAGTSAERLEHHKLPRGTRLKLLSRRGNIFLVESLGTVFGGHSLQVVVIQVPFKYSPTVEPTIMCVVPQAAKVEIIADAYEAAIKTIGRGDVVYLLDRHVGGRVRPLIVASVSVVNIENRGVK